MEQSVFKLLFLRLIIAMQYGNVSSKVLERSTQNNKALRCKSWWSIMLFH